MFTTLITQPLFNLLVLIYALIPGHNFGLAIILFTILIRLLMWPLVKKQLHHAKAMRELQPELKRIKQAAGGDRQKESAMVMELYRERQINPFSSIGLVILQIPIFIGLYSGLHRIITDPRALIDFSYSFVNNLRWMKEVAADISKFDETLFGVVNLTRSAAGNAGAIYWPAMIIVLGSAIAQYFQAKQLMPSDDKKRKLRHILKDASGGQRADQTEINAAVGRSTRFLLPAVIFIITVNLASALSLYWLTSGLVAFLQQSRVLKQDETELEAVADKPNGGIIEGEVVPPANTAEKRAKKHRKKSYKRKVKRRGRAK